MIDWGAGFFAGLKLGFIFILLGCEAYFLIFDKWTDREISGFQTGVLLCAFGAAVLLGVRMSLAALLPVPAAYAALLLHERRRDDSSHESRERAEMERLERMIGRQPHNFAARTALADIHFRRGEYGRALAHYRAAAEINDALPWLDQKIRISAREDRVQRGETRLCPECGAENPPAETRCSRCGAIAAPLESIKADIAAQKRDIRRYAAIILAAPLSAILLAALYKTLPLPVALVVWLGVMYLILHGLTRR